MIGKQDIMVSVCMITYNHENYVAAAIEGVIMQKTDFPIELIIGEDFSTDNTRKICLEYQSKYPDIIKLCNNHKNLGMNANFMSVLKQASGKYIALCEGDDYWTNPEKLQKQIDFLENNEEYVAVFHDVKIEVNTKDRESDFQIKYINDQVDFSIDDFIQQGNRLHTCSVVFRNRKDIFPEKLNPVTTDLFLHINNANYGKFHRFKESMACYRLHDGGVFSQRTQWNVKKKIDFLKRQIEAYLYVKDNLNFDEKSGEKLNLIIRSHTNNLRAYLLLNKEYAEAVEIAKRTPSNTQMDFKEKLSILFTKKIPRIYSSYLRLRSKSSI